MAMKEAGKQSPYRRVVTALHGETQGRIPFTMYETKIPRSTFEREMRNRGLCLVRRITSYAVYYPDVTIKSYDYKDEYGRNVTRTVYSTPYGELDKVVEPAGFTSWKHVYEFKSPDDYKRLRFLIKNAVVVPKYEAVEKEIKETGEDYIFRDSLGLEPMNTLISEYMGIHGFGIEWMDNRDEVLLLYDALVELARKIYPVVADGPMEIANYGGNVIPNVTGVQNFRKYFIPNYNEAAGVLHKKGKLIGCHLDGDNTLIMEDIGRTELDYIEAYDPGMSPSVKTAMAMWPGKALWINWPSAWHLEALSAVREGTLRLLDEARPGNRFIMGIMEDVPEDRKQGNCRIIMDSIDKFYK